MRPVRNWRRFWRWYSTWASGIGVVAGAAWLAVPEDLRAAVPDETKAMIAMALFGLIIVVRIVDQEGEE